MCMSNALPALACCFHASIAAHTHALHHCAAACCTHLSYCACRARSRRAALSRRGWVVRGRHAQKWRSSSLQVRATRLHCSCKGFARSVAGAIPTRLPCSSMVTVVCSAWRSCNTCEQRNATHLSQHTMPPMGSHPWLGCNATPRMLTQQNCKGAPVLGVYSSSGKSRNKTDCTCAMCLHYTGDIGTVTCAPGHSTNHERA
jgi:hypothetical protein